MNATDSDKLWERTVAERPDERLDLAETLLQENVLRAAIDYIETESPGDSEYTAPRYLVALDGDARDLVAVAGFMTPEDEIEGDAEGIFREVRWDDGLITEWVEPAVGLLLAENRDHRWALVSELKNEHLSSEDIEVQKITGDKARTELLCAHPDAIVFDLRESVMSVGEIEYNRTNQ